MPEYIENNTGNIEEARKKLIQAERECYFAGTGKSYTWNEVKNMAIANKELPALRHNRTIKLLRHY